MGTIWFCLVAAILAGYVVLDVFDIGAGILHIFLAKDAGERRLIVRSIGPVWGSNEVCLIVAGATIYLAFPVLYASSFSGFYLPLMIVLWLLILRGISLEFRHHLESPLWVSFWDGAFFLASFLLAGFYGAALGNVVRGVPLDAQGRFFEALWTSFRPVGNTGILDWYTVLTGFVALLALSIHGAFWLAMKTEGSLQVRARRFTSRAWVPLLILTILVTWSSFELQPRLLAGFFARPWGWIFPLIALTGLAGMILFKKDNSRAFASSCAYLIGMLGSVAFGLYPEVLPSSSNPAFSLTIQNAQASEYGLKVGLIWWVIGMALATVYFVLVYRHFAGKVTASEEGNGY